LALKARRSFRRVARELSSGSPSNGMMDIRETIEKNYKSYEESRERFKTELRVLEAKMRAFKYEEDTLRDFAQ
jgi:hypothetical protein